jgi:hypothetical protein
MLAKLRQFFSATFDSSVFVVRLANGQVQLTKGRVPPRFLAELREFVGSEKLVSGVIRGQRQETYVRLVFSREIPPEIHQKLRNIWHAYEPSFQTDSP